MTWRFVVRKLGFYVVAAWAAVTLNFVLPRLIPGNPVEALVARESRTAPVTPEEIHSLELLLGEAHGSIFLQYWHYLVNVAQLKFGRSVTFFPERVSTIIAERLPWTICLVGVATVISFAVGIGIGIVVGWRRGPISNSIASLTTFIASLPYFWIALVLVYFLAVKAHILPFSDGYNPALSVTLSWRFIGSILYHALLPAATIVLSSIGGWILGMRNLMVSTLAEDYVVAAEARGVPRRRIMLGYVARNALLPNVASFAISLGFIVSGAIVMEVVFSYPGIGYTLFQAVGSDDYPLMQAIFLIITFAVLGANLVVDFLYGFIDPRTRTR